jgi:hypothetical protein
MPHIQQDSSTRVIQLSPGLYLQFGTWTYLHSYPEWEMKVRFHCSSGIGVTTMTENLQIDVT